MLVAHGFVGFHYVEQRMQLSPFTSWPGRFHINRNVAIAACDCGAATQVLGRSLDGHALLEITQLDHISIQQT